MATLAAVAIPEALRVASNYFGIGNQTPNFNQNFQSPIPPQYFPQQLNNKPERDLIDYLPYIIGGGLILWIIIPSGKSGGGLLGGGIGGLITAPLKLIGG